MVDVGGKQVTSRVAVAEVVETTPDVVGLLAQGELPKGEALGVARIAGIMGAKATSALIPLCHPLVLDGVDIDLEPGDDRVRIEARVRTAAAPASRWRRSPPSASRADRLRHDQGRRPRRRHHRHPGPRERGRQERLVEPVVSRTAVAVVASTRAASGVYEDRTGPALLTWFESRGWSGRVVVVADGDAVGEAISDALSAGIDVVITTGGTGVAPSDVTPEQTAPLLERELPGLAEAIRAPRRRATCPPRCSAAGARESAAGA